MIRHIDLGGTDFARKRRLVSLIRSKQISLGGNRPGKIYGRLDCRAGKRMKQENRVFFREEAEAIRLGYRPCAVCLPVQYQTWKATI
ncbi:Ada metal-binding domain-containing protein [Spirosoma daeguense]